MADRKAARGDETFPLTHRALVDVRRVPLRDLLAAEPDSALGAVLRRMAAAAEERSDPATVSSFESSM